MKNPKSNEYFKYLNIYSFYNYIIFIIFIVFFYDIQSKINKTIIFFLNNLQKY